jgi:hypothetical protein
MHKPTYPPFYDRVPSYEEAKRLYESLGDDPESRSLKALVALEMNRLMRSNDGA